MKRLIVCALAVLSALSVFGHNPSDSVRVYFSLNQGRFDPSLRSNAASINSFINKIRTATETDNLDHIVIYGYASPDGPLSFNERLAKSRCESIAAYIIQRTGIGREVVQTRPMGIAWDELRRIVIDRQDIPAREQILDILDNTSPQGQNPRGGVPDRKKQLESLAGGKPYQWLLDHVFPQLRQTLAASIYLKSDIAEAADTAKRVIAVEASGNADALCTADSLRNAGGIDSTTIVSADVPESTVADQPAEANDTVSARMPAQIGAGEIRDPLHRLAIKTNMLYYAILMPNLEVEWLIDNHWSVALEGNVAWWGDYSRDKSYRVALISPEVRRWINPREPWHGMYVGAFAGGCWYDLLRPSHTGHHGEGLMTGLSFGYMWPIGRNLSLEAGVGAGYAYTRVKEYVPYDGHHLYQRTKTINYFGPMKVKFSLAWRLFDVNKNTKPIKSEP